MLEVLTHGPRPDEVTVIAGLGPTCDGYRNIQARPATEIAIGRDRFTPVHRTLGHDEAVAVLADYEQRHRLAGRLIRPVLSGLLGSSYNAGPQSRARLADQLPMIAFRPAENPARRGSTLKRTKPSGSLPKPTFAPPRTRHAPICP